MDEQEVARRAEFLAKVSKETDRAIAKHGDNQWNRHEFYGILLEEVDEVWDAIKRNLPQEHLEDELLQVACVCLRYFETRDRDRGNNER